MKKRVVAIDMAKGIGMLWIMMAHSGNLFPLHEFFYQMYVPIFYVCSGFTFHEGILKEEIKNAVVRLLIPYGIYSFVCVIGGVAIDAFCGRLTLENVWEGIISALYGRWCLYPIDVVDNIMLNKYFAGAWFLPSLFLSSVCFSVVKHWAAKVKKKKAFYYVIVTFILAVTVAMSHLPILLPWSIDTMFVGALFMLCGWALRRTDFMQKKPELKGAISFLISIIFVCILISIDNEINMSIRVYGGLGNYSIFIFTLNAIMSCIICLVVCKVLQCYKLFAILGYIGKATLTIYSIHRIIYALFDMYIYSGRFEGEQIWWANCIKIVITLTVCLLVDWLYKRTKKELIKRNSFRVEQV